MLWGLSGAGICRRYSQSWTTMWIDCCSRWTLEVLLLLDFPWFDVGRRGFLSSYHLVELCRFVVLLLAWMVDIWTHWGISTAWWLVPCILLKNYVLILIPVNVFLWMLLHTRCHIVREYKQGVLAYFWIYTPSSRSRVDRTFSFGTECALQFYSRVVVVSISALVVDHSRYEYSWTNNLMWRHYLLLGL